MKAVLFILFFLPFMLYAWTPQCSFAVQQSNNSPVKLTKGSVGNLLLISFNDITPSLPHYSWLKQQCAHYRTSTYPTVLLEGDSSRAEWQTLSNQKLLVYSSARVYSSIHNTPSSLSPSKPVLMRFPSDFQKG